MTATAPRPSTGRPARGEFADYAADDIGLVQGDDAIAALASQRDRMLSLLAPLTDPTVEAVTYAPGKWTMKDVLTHLADDERIFAYRILCIARGDPRPLPGFDEQVYAMNAAATSRLWTAVLADYRCVRDATLTLLDGLPPDAWRRQGEVNGYSASVRGLAFHIAGHELRHLAAIETLYWPHLRTPASAT